MSVKIGIGIKQNSYSNSSNSSSVTVTVTATWKGVSWNHTNPPGWVKIDGTKYSFNASFNKRKTKSGSCTLYSKKVTVKHNSNRTKKLSCSASYSSNVSSGTVTASASKTLSASTTTSSSSSKTTSSKRATVTALDVQTGTDRTVFATWSWSKGHTDHYTCRWYYDTGNGVWFHGGDSDVTKKQVTFNAPENSTRIKFYVKPVAKKHKVRKKEVAYWSAEWSTVKYYSFKDNPPSTPPVPDVEIEGTKLTAEVNNLDINVTHIEFQIVRDDTSIYKTGMAAIITSSATYSCDVVFGSEYKVRCRGVKGKEYSGWSEYSGNVETIPSTPKAFTEIKALSSTSIYLDWDNVKNCDSYTIEYTEKKEYFDSSNKVSSISVESVVSHAEIIDIATGKEWFFRIKAVNENGSSEWSEIGSIVIGKPPSAPTTWSSTTTAIVGEPLNLYWVHNAEDGSSQTFAELEIYVNDVKETYTIEDTRSEDEKDKTSTYSIDTSGYTEGVVIKWRVRTAGATKEYGNWSVQRTVDIYAKPTLELTLTDVAGELLSTVESFPFYISGLAGPNTQEPISYHLSIISNEIYESVDQIGNTKLVNVGDAVYSNYFDTSDALLVEMTAGNIDLENNVPYTVLCTVSMNSGLTAEASLIFDVSWVDEKYIPDAEIGINNDDLTAMIRPYCEYYKSEYYKVLHDATANTYTKTTELLGEIDGVLVEGVVTDTGDAVFATIVGEEEVYFCMIQSTEASLVEDVLLSVYRREYDGSFIEIATGLDNTRNIYITDPHPALDYARYRIVATTKSTGSVSYYDAPGYPVNESSIVIQWDEDWSEFDSEGSEDELEQVPWSGSMLKLPYNVDVSDSNKSDTSLIKYIGRKRPVSYYGTQLGESSTWNCEIVKDDVETLYAIRRLAIWMGDVYVREPSGSGYWANISVSYNQKHLELTIPVTFTITRVEGGI